MIGTPNLKPEARFMDIGGNSLNLVEVLKRVKQDLGVTPSPRMFFDKNDSSIAAISDAIDAQLQQAEPVQQAASHA